MSDAERLQEELEVMKLVAAKLLASTMTHSIQLVKEARAAERERCARVAESYEPHCEGCSRAIAAAIRAVPEEEKS